MENGEGELDVTVIKMSTRAAKYFMLFAIITSLAAIGSYMYKHKVTQVKVYCTPEGPQLYQKETRADKVRL